MADDLYKQDFFAWTQAQAEALRQRGRGANALDYDNLADEVGDMGLRDLRECRSRIRTILEHLLKLQASQMDDPKAGWRETISRERDELAATLTTSLRAQLVSDLEELHQRAFKLAVKAFETHEPGNVGNLDPTGRWTFDEILGD